MYDVFLKTHAAIQSCNIIDKTFNGGAICLNNGTCTLMRGPQSVLLNELI